MEFNCFRREWLEGVPVIGILRGFPGEAIGPIVRASLAAGLRNLEITMNTAGATDQIREAIRVAEGRMNIGAGTVTDTELLARAVAGGAIFIVAPAYDRGVAGECRARGIPFFPGAYSPTEVWRAWEEGAEMVKVFPADRLGAGYLRALKAVFPEIKLMPTGGVSLANLRAYCEAGADAFGVGGPMYDPELIASEAWEAVELRCRAFVRAVKAL